MCGDRCDEKRKKEQERKDIIYDIAIDIIIIDDISDIV